MSMLKLISAAAIAAGLAASAWAADLSQPQTNPSGSGMMMGPGMMGSETMNQGMMPGMMMGHGMMSGMMGTGMGTCGMMGMTGGASAPLTVDQVKQNLTQWLAWQGNPRLKLGAVTEQKDGAISAEITTQDGSLVQKFIVNRATGWYQQAP